MRGPLHVLATIVTVPYLLLAAAFLIGGQVIAAGSPWNMLDMLLAHALWLIPWGAIGIAVVVFTIAVLGAYPPTRRVGGALLALVATASLVVIVLIDRSGLDAGALVFLLPCALALACGLWLAFGDRPAAAVAG